MALSSDERALLLAIAMAEEQEQWERFESILGIRWDLATLVGAGLDDKKGQDKKPEPEQLSNVIRVPLMVALAPEFFKAMAEEQAKKYRSIKSVEHESGGGQVIEIGSLSPQAARDILKQVQGKLDG